MNGTILLLGGTIVFLLGYFLYGRFLEKLLGIDAARPTPSHTMRDGVDYVPAHPAVLFGHHFASIAGAGPIVGPIMAAYFGWASVLAWVVIGCIFIGAVHDMVSLYLSVRHEGKSIASVIETVLGRPGRLLFLLFCWSTLILVCAEFTRQVAATFVPHPEVATSSMLFIALAVVFGLTVNRLRMKLLYASIIFVPIMFACVWFGTLIPCDFQSLFGVDAAHAQTIWVLVLLVYCFLASTLPVWLLLQPRDYLNSYLLYAMMLLGFLGVLVASPSFAMEPFTGFHVQNAVGAKMALFPILFVTVACGACSGFHSLVASGTTAKQIASEKHIRPIAYGGMLLEGLLAILSLIAVGGLSCAGLTGELAAGKSAVALFSSGLASFCVKLGLPEHAAFTFLCLSVAAFLMTSVDTATRLGRFCWQELVSIGSDPAAPKPAVRLLGNKFVATGLLIGLIALLLLGNPAAAKNLWTIFASANQLLAALTLLTASLWLYKHRMAYWVTLAPMLFMLAVSGYGLFLLFGATQSLLLKITTGVLLALALVLIVFSIAKFLAVRKSGPNA